MKVSRKPILDRFYVFSSKWFGIKLHHIKQSDPEFHNHPWWGLSIILGWYWEEYEDQEVAHRLAAGELIDFRQPRHFKFLINIISPWKKHRVIVKRPVWTIFLHGPRRNEKWVYGNSMAPWRGPDK